MSAVELSEAPPGSNRDVTFSFHVSWRYLSEDAAKLNAPAHQPLQVPSPEQADVSVPSGLAIRELGAPECAPAGPSQIEWEMIIPKRERPSVASYSLAKPIHRVPANREPAVTAIPQKRAEEKQPEAVPERIFCHSSEAGSIRKLWSRFGVPVVICLGVAATLVAGMELFVSVKASQPSAAGAAPNSPATVSDEPNTVLGDALPMGFAGWIPEFAGIHSFGPKGHRRVPVMRASLQLTDYRSEFQLRIEAKAVGWVFRAKDAGNFYVNKIEIIKPVPNPQIVLTRFAVIEGKEQPRKQIPLANQNWVDTLFRVRLEAFGSHFTTWIQDRKVDEWTDARIRAGGIGLYFERGENGTLKGDMQVFPLARR